MKTKLWFLTITFVFFTGSAFAETTKWTFQDTYIGNPNTSEYSQDVKTRDNDGNKVLLKGDVVSMADEINNFNVDKMIVKINDKGHVTIKVKTDYTTGTRETIYGDLFISSTDYSETNFFNPDTVEWNYVFDTSSNAIYNTSSDNGQFVTSNDMGNANGWDTDWYRRDHKVLFDPSDEADASGTGKFKKTNKFLVYGFDLEDLGITDPDEGYELAFMWAMTCANDVAITDEISVPAAVPEPGTILLLGMGLLGIGAASRKKISGLP